MMKDRSFQLALAGLLGILLAAGCSPGAPALAPTPTTEPVDWQRPVDEMAALVTGLDPPEHLLQEGATRTGDEFDPNAYFEVLDRISIEPGYVLDYVYWYDFMGGKPVLYVRESAASPYRTFEEYSQAWDDSPDEYLNHVRVDGSPEGFYQLAVLRIMGGRFYLWWHGLMDDQTILTCRESLEGHLEAVEADCTVETGPVLEGSSSIELTPRVDFDGDRVRVSLVVFTRWGGLKQLNLTFNREYPHTLLEETTETLVPYDCGVVY